MKDEEFGKIKNVIVPSLISAGIALGVLTALLFIITAVLYQTSDPCKLTDASSVLLLIIPSFLSGVIGAKKTDSILGGIISGAVLTFLLMIVSLFFKNSGNPSALSQLPYSIIIRLSGIIAVIGGAVLSAYLSSKNKNSKLGVKMPKIKKYR